MTRVLGDQACYLSIQSIEDINITALDAWLLNQTANKFLPQFMLAHMDDGVIWGKIDNNTLILPPQNQYTPALRLETLQNVRVFGEKGELHLWRNGDGLLQAVITREDGKDSTDYFDEDQVLWGDHSIWEENAFLLVADGSQGLHHAIPLLASQVINTDTRPLRLKVRHYITEDEFGFARIAHSRLVNLHGGK